MDALVICRVEDCGPIVPASRVRHGWCSRHYQRWRKHGSPTWEPPAPVVGCSIAGCARPHKAQGLCGMHEMRMRRHGSLELPEKPQRRCAIADCPEPWYCNDWCRFHYHRWVRHGDPLVLMRERNDNPPATCQLPGCNEPHHAKGLCLPHYSQANHQANRERANERMRAHYRTDPLTYSLKTQRRRRGLAAGLTADERAASQEYRRAIAADPCRYCGAAGEQTDHYFPVAKGGTDHWWNLCRACGWCNRSKAAHCGTWFVLRAGVPGEPRRRLAGALP
jgi:HNH endonuclease